MSEDADFRFDHLPSTSGLMARLAFAQAKAAGLAPELMLSKSGLTVHQIEQAHVRVAVRRQITFLNLVAEALGDDLLGFHLACVPDLRQIGLLYYTMASSDVLIDALQRGARYTSIVNEGVSSKVIDDAELRIRLNYVGVTRHADRHQMEFWMTALVRICRQLSGRRVLPSRVRFIHFRDPHGAQMSEYLGNDIQFAAPVDEIVFEKRTRDFPVHSADPYLNSLLVRYCDEALAERQIARESFRSRVENAMVPLLPHGKARVAEVAYRLGVSPRTLARRLTSEGISFSSVLDQLRMDLARRYLAEKTLPISELAWLLGYQEVGAFSHAFRRWTGKSPRQARASVAYRVGEAAAPATLDGH
jgi:AraC-like DNA-binding protein